MHSLFPINSRHFMSVTLNGTSGLCDVLVSEELTNKTFAKSLVLTQYNKLVDFLKANDHCFAMESVHLLF
jgi:hypothetical protein